jgi:hypothetical protein
MSDENQKLKSLDFSNQTILAEQECQFELRATPGAFAQMGGRLINWFGKN